MFITLSVPFARFSPAYFSCFYSVWGEEEDKVFLGTSGGFCAFRVMPLFDQYYIDL